MPEQHFPPVHACAAGAVLHAHAGSTLEPAVVLHTLLPPVAAERRTLSTTDGDAVETVGAIGIVPRPRVTTERLPAGEALENSGTIAVQMLDGIKQTVTEKLPTITKVYSDERDPAAARGAAQAVQSAGRSALGEVGRLVRLIREEPMLDDIGPFDHLQADLTDSIRSLET